MKKLLAVIAGLGIALMLTSSALATPPVVGHKVTICHRTNSVTNPYVEITVDIAAAGYGEGRGDHAAEHQGPVGLTTTDFQALKDARIKWGDIIPAYEYETFSFPGLNWTEDGQAVYNNDCAPVNPPADDPPNPQAIATVVGPSCPDNVVNADIINTGDVPIDYQLALTGETGGEEVGVLLPGDRVFIEVAITGTQTVTAKASYEGNTLDNASIKVKAEAGCGSDKPPVPPDKPDKPDKPDTDKPDVNKPKYQPTAETGFTAGAAGVVAGLFALLGSAALYLSRRRIL